MASITLEDVRKEFPGGVVAVDDLSLRVEDGEFMVLVGPSGCGKSTILRMIAGLEEGSSGRILIGEDEVTRWSPRDRDVAMVFQNYALYPYMSVEANIGFGLKLRRVPRKEIRRLVADVAETLGLSELLNRRPGELSGGQRQRVAIGRAMVREPLAYLMDEPLSNLDAKLRVQMRTELSLLQDRLATTTIYVTHDQVEAMTMGDRVAVLDRGRLQQVATPKELFALPTNLFVARFIGSPPMNIVNATRETGSVSFGSYRLSFPNENSPRWRAGKDVVLGIRPSSFQDAELWPSDRPTIDVVVDAIEELGTEVNAIFTVDASSPGSAVATPAGESSGSEAVQLPVPGSDGKVGTTFIARLDPRTKARPGSRIRLAVDTTDISFFDPGTGDSLSAPVPVNSEPSQGANVVS